MDFLGHVKLLRLNWDGLSKGLEVSLNPCVKSAARFAGSHQLPKTLIRHVLVQKRFAVKIT